MKALIVATFLLVSCAPVASPPGASPTASTSVVPSARPTPSPTATVAAGLTRYVNSELGYSVDLPAGWRRATCSQGIVTVSPLEASEMFVGVAEAEEVIRGGVRLIQVRVIESNGVTPLAWLERNTSQPDARVEATTLNERTGARAFIGASGFTYGFAFAARGWIYAIEATYFGTEDQELGRILTTLRLLDDATVGRAPAATAVPRTIESLADSIADAFTKKDVAAIAATMAPCITVGAVPGDPDLRSRTAYVTTLAADFAAGTSVQVQSRPIESDPNLGRFVRSTWSKPGEPNQRVDLLFRADRDRWSVSAVLIRTSGN
jgi:ketosteroid isomerase-like protein